MLLEISVAWVCDLPRQTDQSSVAVHAGALLAVPVSLRHPPVHQDRLNSETAFAKQNEGLLTGEALLKGRENPASCTLGMRKKRDGNPVYKLSLLSNFFCCRTFSVLCVQESSVWFGGGQMLARHLGFVMAL